MKYFKKVSLLFIMLFLSMNVVKAYPCDANTFLGTKGNNFSNNTGLVIVGTYPDNSTDLHGVAYFNMTSNDGVFTTYCRNAGFSNGGNTYACQEVVFDPRDEDEDLKAYDAGVVEIFKQGYNNIAPGSYSLSQMEEAFATNTALRIYEMYWPSRDTNGNNLTNSNRATRGIAQYFLEDNGMRNLLQRAVGTVRASFEPWYYLQFLDIRISDLNGASVKDRVLPEIRRLLEAALNAAIQYRQNGSAKITWNDEPIVTNRPTSSGPGGNYSYERSYTYNFNVQNFRSSGAYIKLSLDCPECSRYNVQYELYVNDRRVSNTTVDLMSYLRSGSGNVSVKLVFKANSNNYNCQTLNYNLNVNYFDETIDTIVYSLRGLSCPAGANCQEYYMLRATDSERNNVISKEFELCSSNCYDLQRECEEEGNQEACERWEDEYDSNCTECTSYVGNMECSENGTEIDIKEGYRMDGLTCLQGTSEDILNCIIGGHDKAGNSYESNYTDDNQFCRVFCKEDYHLSFPGNKTVSSGRYFTLQASISGAKTCYTDQINRQLFVTRYEELQQQMIKAYNKIQAFSASVGGNLYNPEEVNGDSAPGESDYCSGGSGSSQYDCEASGGSWEEGCSGDSAGRYSRYKRRWEFNQIDPNSYSQLNSGSFDSSIYNNSKISCSGVGTIQCTYDDPGDPGSCGTCNCYSDATDGEDFDMSTYSGELAAARSEFSAAINELRNLLREYNSCVEWDMSYQFDPEIKYDYEEVYMGSAVKDTLDTVGSIHIGAADVEMCGRSFNDTDPYADVVTSLYGCVTNTGSSENWQRVVCDAGSETCSTSTVEVITTVRMKQSIEANGDFITPTQYYTIYPSGSIAASDNGGNIENGNALENKLPVGLGTPQGVYSFALIVKNLGEYYNTNRLGRIWGDENSVVVNVLRDDDDSCTIDGALKPESQVGDNYYDDGVYVCAYRVNCPDCPVECDENGCYNPDCPDNSCPVVCDSCLYSNNNSNVSYRPVTPGDLNPNNRDLGKNWAYDDNIETALELKAYVTTEEIESDGEDIYDIDFTEDDNDFAMKVKMDSTMINKIRDYNDRYEGNGGYANNTMKCYDHTNSLDGHTYRNVYCYSTFIDELLYDNSTKNKIEIKGNRIIGSDANSSDNLRRTQTQASGYWTTWDMADTSNWHITTNQSLSYYRSNYANIGVGPSWK